MKVFILQFRNPTLQSLAFAEHSGAWAHAVNVFPDCYIVQEELGLRRTVVYDRIGGVLEMQATIIEDDLH